MSDAREADRPEKVVALVTGASQGLGAVMARRLAAKGCLVIVNYAHSASKAEAVVGSIRQAGGEAVAYGMDVSDEAAVQTAFADFETRYGGIHVLVNNARVDPLSRRPEQTDGQWWDHVMGVGLRGAYLCCNEFFKYAPKRKWGRVINVSSARAHQPNDLPNLAYSTTKLGVHCLTRSYAAYGAQFGVTVNTLAPGMILTENLMKRLDPAAYERDTKIIALRRPGTMDEVADGLIFLYECGFVTGETININGGQTYAP